MSSELGYPMICRQLREVSFNSDLGQVSLHALPHALRRLVLELHPLLHRDIKKDQQIDLKRQDIVLITVVGMLVAFEPNSV